jgi:hypothetical protein
MPAPSADPNHQQLALAIARVLRSAWQRHQATATTTNDPAGAADVPVQQADAPAAHPAPPHRE